MIKRFLTLKEASEFLGVSESYLYKATARKEIPFCRLGKKILFDIKKIETFMDSTSIEPINWQEKIAKWQERA